MTILINKNDDIESRKRMIKGFKIICTFCGSDKVNLKIEGCPEYGDVGDIGFICTQCSNEDWNYYN